MDQELDSQIASERFKELVNQMADSIISEKQIENKGALLGHYVSLGFTRTYIDVYENAVVGKVKIRYYKKPMDICWGYARLSRAAVEKGILYLMMNDKSVYRIKHLKSAEKIAYLINSQKAKQNVSL